jgi:hypothetical protein
MQSCGRYYGLFPINRNSSFAPLQFSVQRAAKIWPISRQEFPLRDFITLEELQGIYYPLKVFFFFYIAQIPSTVRQSDTPEETKGFRFKSHRMKGTSWRETHGDGVGVTRKSEGR